MGCGCALEIFRESAVAGESTDLCRPLVPVFCVAFCKEIYGEVGRALLAILWKGQRSFGVFAVVSHRLGLVPSRFVSHILHSVSLKGDDLSSFS